MIDIDSQYEHLIETARDIAPSDYQQFHQSIIDDFENKITGIPENFHSNIYPMNFKSRLEYIESRPNQYHSIIQLKALHEEFVKRYAAFRAKNG